MCLGVCVCMGGDVCLGVWVCASVCVWVCVSVGVWVCASVCACLFCAIPPFLSGQIQVHYQQSWALSVFFNFFINKNYFLHFL